MNFQQTCTRVEFQTQIHVFIGAVSCWVLGGESGGYLADCVYLMPLGENSADV